MDNKHYVHESGLRFDVERLVSADEKSSHDITVIVVWLPNRISNCMELIDWYYGEPDMKLTKEYADNWCTGKCAVELADLVKSQNA